MKELIALIEEAIPYAILLVSIYATFSLCTVFAGLDGTRIHEGGKFAGKIPCLEHPTNFEMLFPSYKMGCWLGAKQGEKYYWSKP